MITGGTDGIGLQFAKDLACQGFSICILARNETKIISKLSEIKDIATKAGHVIQTAYEVVDFSKQYHIEDYAAIAKRLSSLDVGFLICNAGAAAVGDFANLTNEQVERTLVADALQYVYLIKAMLPHLLLRESQRSGLLIVGSGLGSFPCCGWLALSIVKSLQSFLGQGLNYELRHKVDVTSFECGEVVTQTNNNPPNFFRCMPEVATKAALRDMGKDAVTCGTWR